ncbi:unnamed protein product [Gongylonema pulchrum]|uniref:FAD_binding_2 domain-containing protein n=1 Tax=Gongylonema pulchrum TaxID=637853 RepID=A0A183DK06_9BILA|nr:unnamed protein product [Gongylonema pulchrum]
MRVLSYVLILMIAKASPMLPDFSDPVIIVGGGLAGLSATLEAIHEGANVIVIEGEKDFGGNSQKVCFKDEKKLR